MKNKIGAGLIISSCLLLGCASSDRGKTGIDVQRAAQARLALGLAYLAEDNRPLAYQNIQRALDYTPNDYRVQLGMALYEQQVGDHTAAAQRYQTLLKARPVHGIIYNNYAVFLCATGKYSEALQQVNYVIALKDSLLIAESLENAGYCALSINKSDHAAAFFVKMAHYAPEKKQQLLIVASDYIEQKKFKQAQLLVDIYEQIDGVKAGSLWLKIRLAALEGRRKDKDYHGEQLTQYFPQTKEYQKFIANEY